MSQLFRDLSQALKNPTTDSIRVGVVSAKLEEGKIRVYLSDTGLQSAILSPVSMGPIDMSIIEVDKTRVVWLTLASNHQGYWVGVVDPGIVS